MSDSLIMSMYEEGRTVKEIAKAIDKSLLEVNKMLAKTDDTQTVQVARQEKHVRDLRRIRALADSMTQKYLETLNAVIDDPDSTVDEKANAFGEMDMRGCLWMSLRSTRAFLRHGKGNQCDRTLKSTSCIRLCADRAACIPLPQAGRRSPEGKIPL